MNNMDSVEVKIYFTRCHTRCFEESEAFYNRIQENTTLIGSIFNLLNLNILRKIYELRGVI